MAFTELYDRYFDRLCGFAGSFLKDPDAAQDAVQEVFLRFIRQSEKFDTERKFSSWIFQVTRNQSLNVLRNEENRKRIRTLMAATDQSCSGDPAGFDYRLLEKRIDTALAGLNERDRKIYQLRFEEERSIREISQATATPEGTVKSAIFYMLKKISKQLKEFIHE